MLILPYEGQDTNRFSHIAMKMVNLAIENFLTTERRVAIPAETAMAVSAGIASYLKQNLALSVADGDPLGLDFAGLGQAEGQNAVVILGGDMLLIHRGR